MTEQLRILIADDHELFRVGIKSLIESIEGMLVIGEASSGQEAIAFIRQQPVDLLILDYSMPDGDGLSVLAALNEMKFANLAVIMLTAVGSPLIIDAAIEAGVSAVIAKKGSGQELVAAIKAVKQGERFFTNDIKVLLAEAEVLKFLTRRETEVLLSLLEGNDTQGVADTLSISFKTAETHKTRVMQKLDVHSTQALLGLSRQLGLITE